MTESDAYTCWCPMIRFSSDATITITNRGEEVQTYRASTIPRVESSCVGSDCMAWRWKDEEAGDGYCGLTGKQD